MVHKRSSSACSRIFVSSCKFVHRASNSLHRSTVSASSVSVAYRCTSTNTDDSCNCNSESSFPLDSSLFKQHSSLANQSFSSLYSSTSISLADHSSSRVEVAGISDCPPNVKFLSQSKMQNHRDCAISRHLHSLVSMLAIGAVNTSLVSPQALLISLYVCTYTRKYECVHTFCIHAHDFLKYM